MTFSLSQRQLAYQSGEIPGLQILKLICAFLVVQIHTSSFIKDYFYNIYDVAVPIFFIINGYFLVRKNGLLETCKIWKSIKKVFWLWLVSNCFYLLLNFTLNTDRWHGAIHEMFTNPHSMALFFVIGDTISIALWYLTILIQVLFILLILTKVKIEAVIYALPIVGLIFSFLLGHNLLPEKLGILSMLVSRGLLFIPLGIILRRHESNRLNTRLATIFVIASIAIYLLCYHIRGKLPFLTEVAIVLLAALTFSLFKNLSISKFARLFVKCGRDYSLYIYILHLAVLILVAAIGININAKWQTFGIILITLAISAVVFEFKKFSKKHINQ